MKGRQNKGPRETEKGGQRRGGEGAERGREGEEGREGRKGTVEGRAHLFYGRSRKFKLP